MWTDRENGQWSSEIKLNAHCDTYYRLAGKLIAHCRNTWIIHKWHNSRGVKYRVQSYEVTTTSPSFQPMDIGILYLMTSKFQDFVILLMLLVHLMEVSANTVLSGACIFKKNDKFELQDNLAPWKPRQQLIKYLVEVCFKIWKLKNLH